MPLFDSTSDERIENNAVRHNYRTLTDEEKESMQEIKDAGLAFLTILDAYCDPGRETEFARAKIEEAVMWAVKGITA